MRYDIFHSETEVKGSKLSDLFVQVEETVYADSDLSELSSQE